MVTLLFFSGQNCGVCKAIKPRLFTEVEEYFPQVNIKVIDVALEPVLAGQYSVFTLPVVILLQNETERKRWVRSFGIREILEHLELYQKG